MSKISVYLTFSIMWCMPVAFLAGAESSNIDLVTVPSRAAVELTIYNSADLTLVKERRSITLKKGANRLQFSWANTLIDPTSVELRPLEQQDLVDVADTVFPGRKPQHLLWNIVSDFEGQIPVEVSYFTSGLTWRMDYVAISDPTLDSLQMSGHVRVFNNSGEEYEDASIRLVVGKINLVEAIADLAQAVGQDDDFDEEGASRTKDMLGRRSRVRKELEKLISEEERLKEKETGIVKQGLSEYFLFTLPGTSTVRNGWSKRIQAIDAADVQFDIVYRLRTYQYGPRPVRFFIWKNDQEHQLGDSPLPDGMVRVFRENGQGGLAILGMQKLNYVPIQSNVEVNLGVDDTVVHRSRLESTARKEFRFHPSTQNVVGWDEHRQRSELVRNFQDRKIRFEHRLRWNGDIEVAGDQRAKSFDYNTLEVTLDVPSGQEVKFPYHMTIHQGSNAKQNRVTLLK